MNSYLKELIKLLVEQDAKDPKAPFGQYLFGPDQKNKRAQQEKNTKIENTFNKLLVGHYRHIVDDDMKLGKFFLKYIKPELERGNYTKYLAPPDTMVYRGMKLKIKDFLKLVEMDKAELTSVETLNKGWYLAHKGVLNPLDGKFGAMSWTTEPKTSTSFASAGFEDSISVIFVVSTTNPKNNFFINPNTTLKGFTQRNILLAYPKEKEVISVGQVSFDELVFYIHNTSKEITTITSEKEITGILEKIGLYIQKKLLTANYIEKLVNNIITDYSIIKPGELYKKEILKLIYELDEKKILGYIETDPNNPLSPLVKNNTFQQFYKKVAIPGTPKEILKKQLRKNISSCVLSDAMSTMKSVKFVRTGSAQPEQNFQKELLRALGLK